MARQRPRPRVDANSSKFAGAFVNWGPVGREHYVAGLGKMAEAGAFVGAGRRLLRSNHLGRLFRLSWVPGIWKKLNPKRNVVWSVPLTVKGTRLAEVASGAHDAEFEAAAKAISEAQPRAIIRLGWEMNLQFHGVVRQRPGGRLHRGVPARRRNIQAVLDRLQVRLVSGVGASGNSRPISLIQVTTSSITSVSTFTISNMKAPSRNDGIRTT